MTPAKNKMGIQQWNATLPRPIKHYVDKLAEVVESEDYDSLNENTMNFEEYEDVYEDAVCPDQYSLVYG